MIIIKIQVITTKGKQGNKLCINKWTELTSTEHSKEQQQNTFFSVGQKIFSVIFYMKQVLANTK